MIERLPPLTHHEEHEPVGFVVLPQGEREWVAFTTYRRALASCIPIAQGRKLARVERAAARAVQAEHDAWSRRGSTLGREVRLYP